AARLLERADPGLRGGARAPAPDGGRLRRSPATERDGERPVRSRWIRMLLCSSRPGRPWRWNMPPPAGGWASPSWRESPTAMGPAAILAGNVRVGAGAMIGAGAIILPGVEIGEGAMVGAGSVVTRDVEAGDKVMGSAARPVGTGAGHPAGANERIGR